ncbi:hypothetical protein [Rhodopseudomonas sp. RCAM05734]|uniref:hypothetical protein n=1 Tax=Rhodopseudomonas sp. RCAM05734 TaxID=3457549 RepID=UPI004044BDF0
MTSDIDWALEQQTGSAKAKMVLLVLATLSDGSGYVPDTRDFVVAELAEMPLDSVRTQIARLHERWFIQMLPAPEWGYRLIRAADEQPDQTNVVTFPGRRAAS